MSIVSINKGEALTSSLVVAEEFGRRHDNVTASIKKLIDGGSISLLDFKESEYTNDRGKKYPMYELTERGFLIAMPFIGGSKAEQGQARLVDAFLDSHQQPKDLATLLISAGEELKARDEKIALMKPKADFCDQVSVAPDAITLGKAAKLIGTGRNRLISYMRQIGWLARTNEPYQSKIELGYLDVRLGEWKHPDHGLQSSVTALVTGKGLIKLKELWRENHASKEAAA